MSVSVAFSDPTGRYTSKSSLLVRNFEAAWAMWSAYLAPTDASIEVNFHLVSDYANRGGGRSLTSVAEVTTSSGVIAAQGAAYELRTGIDPNGTVADIEVFFDVDFMTTWYWIDPLDGSTTPSGKYNLVDVIAHELGHALGFNGFINQTTFVKPQYISRFDQLIEVRDGAPFFTGEKAVVIYGGAVPITPGNVFHVGSSPNFRMDTDLMNGLILTKGYRYAISALDVAILSDTGVATVLSDKLIGSGQADRMYGGAGDDVITSFGGQ